MTKTGFTYIGLIVDRSGSMDLIKTDMEGALNHFLTEQKKVPGECEASLYTFDTHHETPWEHRPLQGVPFVRIEPRGGTALLDAIGLTVNRMGQHFSSLPEDQRPEKILVIIVTDGMENSSKEFSRDKIAEMIKHQEDHYGWAFTYLGANQDSFNEAGILGFSQNRTANYGANTAGTQSVSANLIAATTRMRGAAGQNASSSYLYTPEEQDAGDQTVSP